MWKIIPIVAKLYVPSQKVPVDTTYYISIMKRIRLDRTTRLPVKRRIIQLFIIDSTNGRETITFSNDYNCTHNIIYILENLLKKS